jgi:hypothetical protein
MAMAANPSQAESHAAFLPELRIGWRLIPPSEQAEHHRQEERTEESHNDRKL